MRSLFNKPPKFTKQILRSIIPVIRSSEQHELQEGDFFNKKLKEITGKSFAAILEDESVLNECIVELNNLPLDYKTNLYDQAIVSFSDDKKTATSERNAPGINNNIMREIEQYKSKINNVISFISEIKGNIEALDEIAGINEELKDLKAQIVQYKKNKSKFNLFSVDNETQKDISYLKFVLEKTLWLAYDKYLIMNSSNQRYEEIKPELIDSLHKRLGEFNHEQILFNGYQTRLYFEEYYKRLPQDMREKWIKVSENLANVGQKTINEYAKFNTNEIEKTRNDSKKKKENTSDSVDLSFKELQKVDYFESVPKDTRLYSLMQRLKTLKDGGKLDEKEYDNIKKSIEELVKDPQLLTLQNIFERPVNYTEKDNNGKEKTIDASLSILKYVLIDLKERDKKTFEKLKNVITVFTNDKIQEIDLGDFDHPKFARFLTEIETGLSYRNNYEGSRLIVNKIFDFFDKLQQNEKEIYLDSLVNAIEDIIEKGDLYNIYTLSYIADILTQEKILVPSDKEKSKLIPKNIQSLYKFLNEKQRTQIVNIITTINRIIKEIEDEDEEKKEGHEISEKSIELIKTESVWINAVKSLMPVFGYHNSEGYNKRIGNGNKKLADSIKSEETTKHNLLIGNDSSSRQP